MSLDWLTQPAADIDINMLKLARERQTQLTKPPGSLGQLETLAITLAAQQKTLTPAADKVYIAIFAADHGVVEEGVAAFPQAVTVEMVKNFSRGGAAISVLAKCMGASLDVINVGTVSDPGPLPRVQSKRIAPGTRNFCQQPAMSTEQCTEALLVGRELINSYSETGIHLFIGGEMGIGNTTTAAAIACALLKKPAKLLAGPGTGLNQEGVAHKATIIESALKLHQTQQLSPVEILRHIGGFEIIALTGAYLTCAQQGIPILVDGFISSVAALGAQHIQPTCADWFILAHQSAEPGHKIVLQALSLGENTPLLDLEMRLGEGSGAAIAIPLIRAACALHNNMATFDEAQVSTKA